jgi:tRNA G26 N,N-dimethylase Trm1
LEYSKNNKYDLVDLDPFGSAYDCFDLAIKMATKCLIITFGELGHKRFKRLDYVSRHYDINNINDFTTDNLIKEVIKIGKRNKKELTPVFIKDWRNISRVYFEINNIKIDYLN